MGRASGLGEQKSGLLFCLWLCLCLASALVHALIPLEAPPIRGTGSAFSASTSAVADRAVAVVAHGEAGRAVAQGQLGSMCRTTRQASPAALSFSLPAPPVLADAPWSERGRTITESVRSPATHARAPPLS